MVSAAAALALPLLFLLPALLFYFFTIRSRGNRKKINLPPGPPQLPVIGNLHQLRPPLHVTMAELSKKYGPVFSIQLGNVPAVVITSPELAREVTKSQDLVFCSRPAMAVFEKFSYNFLDAVFSPYSERWKELRKLYVVELFSSKKVASSRHVREEEVARMISSIATNSGGGAEVDLSEMLERLTNTITCRVAFGKGDPDGGRYGERSMFHEAIMEFHSLAITFFAQDYFPESALGRWIDGLRGLRRRLDAAFRQLDSFYDEVLSERLQERLRKEDKQRKVEGDFTDVLLRLKEERPEEITIEHIKAAFTDIFIGGTDTTATTLTWAVAELINNPRVLNKATAEIRAIAASSAAAAKKENTTTIIIDEEDLSKAHYIKHVVSETLRLHPPGHLLLPRESMAVAKLNGYDILKGTRVYINIGAIARDPKHWEKAAEFWPERFEESAVDYKGQYFEYLPFGSGRRICPGMQLGVSIVELALANLLCAFDWEVPGGAKEVDMEESIGTISHKKTPLRLVPINKHSAASPSP